MNLEPRSFVAVLFGMVLSTSNALAQEPASPVGAEAPSSPPPSESATPTSVPAAASPASEASLVPPAAGQLRIDGPKGSSVRLGLLLQPQLQAVNNPPALGGGYAKNIYVRRARILLGGTLMDNIEYFVDTDYPNLFLDSNTAAAGAPETFAKNTPGMNVQDAFVTFKALGDMLKVDAGYMLPPMAHNAVQGAGTLYSFDYFSYTFQHNAGGVFLTSGNAVGRDAGVQLRGLLVDGHVEYRVGLFQGLRENRTATNLEARNFFRITGRVQVNLLDAEPNFFYAGTYLGAKKIASIGGSYDFQDSYKYFAVDGIVDMPLGPGVVTGQVNLAHWDGGTFIPATALAKQTALMGEAGYAIAEFRLNPILRVERLWPTGGADQTRIGGGVAFWPYGHNNNIKAFYAHVTTDGVGAAASSSYNQFNLQWQVYFF
jgi:hypothetical protein